MSDPHPSSGLRSARLNAAAATAQIVGGIALLALSTESARALPIALTLPGRPAEPFTFVNMSVAFALVAFIAAAGRLIVALPGVQPLDEAGPGGRRRGLRWIEYSQTAGITVFLVAQLNGIVEVGALILVYAIAVGAVLMLWVQDGASRAGSRSLASFSAGAAIGIVPWGVVALYEVVGLALAGEGVGPEPLVRAATIAFLLIAAAHWVSVWLDHRGRGPWGAPWLGESTHVLLTLVSTGVMVAVTALS